MILTLAQIFFPLAQMFTDRFEKQNVGV